VPVAVDLVNVFRAASQVGAIVDECLELGLKRIWIQEGIVNEEAALRAREGGMTVVMDRCILRDYRTLCA
jgi:predicted CoA-binding protein